MSPAQTSSTSFADMSTSTRSSRIIDTSLSVLADAAAITKEVSEMLSHVPYMKAVAGVVLQVLRIRDELKSNEERSRDLIDSIARRSITVFRGLKKVAQSNVGESLEELKSDLLAYARLLEDIHACIAKSTSKATKARISRFISRKEFADRMTKFEARIREFDELFKNNRLISMEVQIFNISNMATKPPSIRMLQKPQLPPKPPFVYGRSEEIEAVVTCLTSQPNKRVAILGPGGMGKTTLAACVMHDDRVSNHYSRRIFVSCDGVTSLELLLVSLSSALRIASEQQNSDLYIAVIEELQRVATMLCLDNFESPWEPPATRPSVEELLDQIAAISTLGLLITMRGTQHPATSTIAWSMPLPRSLQPVKLNAAIDMFERISGKRDDFAIKLINAVDRLPLAVSLLAQLVAEEGGSTEDIWTKWETRRYRTGMLENSGHDRLSNLDVSIQLSVDSPRMTPTARVVLGLLALLPDGFPDTQDMKTKFQNRLLDLSFDDGLTALKRVALAYKDEFSDIQSRIRLLSPVRDFVLGSYKLHTSLSTQKALLELYLKLMIAAYDFTIADNRRIVSPELLNIHALLKHAQERGLTSDCLCEASCDYTRWMSYVGTFSDEAIQWVLQAGELPAGQEGDCMCCIGEICQQRYQLLEAEKSFVGAAELHRKAHSVLGEGTDLLHLGQVYMQRAQLEEAEKSFERAVELYRQAHSVLGEGRAIQNLGEVYMRRYQLEDAEKSFERAAERHRHAQDVLGEGNDLNSLGQVYMLRDKPDEAERYFEQAVELHRQAHSVLGEGNDLQNLGRLYMLRDKPDEAERYFEQAVELHRQAHSVLGEGNDLQNLGRLYLLRDKPDEAEKYFKQAVELHRQAHSVLGEGNDLSYLGEVCMLRDKPDEAEKYFEPAAELHRQAHSVLEEGSDLSYLGEVCMLRDKPDEAEKYFEQAMELHRQVHSVLGEGNDLQNLGRLYLLRDKPGEAERYFEQAVELHRQSHSVLGEGNDLNYLGEVCMLRDNPDEAEKYFEQAVELHRQVHSVLGEGNDLQNLGRLYLLRDKPDEAEKYFEQAVQLHRQAHSVLGEGNDLSYLGEVCMLRGKPDKAERYFEQAVELHRQAHSVLGEGNDLQNLGRLYLLQDKPDGAEKYFEQALELHRQAHSVLGEGNDLNYLGRLYLLRDQLDEAKKCFERAAKLHRQAQNMVWVEYDLECLAEVYERRSRL